MILSAKQLSSEYVALTSYLAALTELYESLIFDMTISYHNSLQSYLCLSVQNRSKRFSKIQLSISKTR